MTGEKKWYQLSGENADVVISSRVRLARNLREYPFPGMMTDAQRSEVNKLVRDAVQSGSVLGKRFKYIELEKLSVNELVSMVERHLISYDFASSPKGRAMLLLDDESVSIMINEEDHIRIQVMRQGMDIEGAYDLADKVDSILSERLSIAFDERLGYLTACPSNLGTAMRASVMAHLPMIEANGTLRRIGSGISRLGMTIRGMYGEGSGSRGAIYQLSNQTTLGIGESDIIKKLSDVVSQITDMERKARTSGAENAAQIDRIWRAYGLLRSARMISSEEFIDLYSAVRAGVSMGILDSITLDDLNALFVDVQPATMMCGCGKDLTPVQRDTMRAEKVRKLLG